MPKNGTPTASRSAWSLKIDSNPLDCSRPTVALFWFAVGTTMALTVISAYAGRDWTALLRVGSGNPMLVDIERELGAAGGPDATGHDGQLYFLIARDPLGQRGTPDAIAAFDNNGPRYRYRRILFPVLSGGLGQFGGSATLFSMVAWLVVGFGLATVAIADIGNHVRVRGPATLIATVNPGALVSLLVLTGDSLALGLSLSGLTLVLRERYGPALVLLGAAALTKETYLLVPLSVSLCLWRAERRSRALTFAAVPAIPLAAWSLWLLRAMPGPSPAMRNLGWPLEGIAHMPMTWIQFERNPVELFLIGFVIAALGVAVLALLSGRNNLLRWTITSWIVLASLAAVPVWEKPNNAARAFAILWPLGVLLLAGRRG